MKRNCSGCKALVESGIAGFSNGEHHCALKYKMECTKTISFIEVEWKPLEECVKPLSITKLIKLMKEKGIRHWMYNC